MSGRLAELETALRRAVSAEVRFDTGGRALYATDGSNYRQVPIGVVYPRSVDEVVEGMAACRAFDVPVLPRGGGTSLAGQSCNVAVVFDMSRHLTKILEVDPDRRTARVQPGVVLDDLRRAAERHSLTFGPDPSTHAYCTLGGMIGNNSCGVHSVSAGRTVDNIETLDVLTYDGVRLRVGPTDAATLTARVAAGGRAGEIYAALDRLQQHYAPLIRDRFPPIPRRVSGYSLPQLLPERGFHVARALIGSEGTCVTVVEATVRLVPSPPARVLLVLGYPDVYQAADAVPRVLEAAPLGLEGMDDRLVADMRAQHVHRDATRALPDGNGWLLVEFGGETRDEARAGAERLIDRLRRTGRTPSMAIADDPDEQEALWLVRESGLGATAHVPGQPLTWEGWEDAAVHPDNLGNYLRDFRQLLDRFGYHGDLYGHFGDGCVHTRIDFDFTTAGGIDTYRRFLDAAAELVVRDRGSFSGEHGDGQSRGALLPRLFGAELMDAFRDFKRIWDPAGRMNPGKKIDADPPDRHLRLGVHYAPLHPPTEFAYADDNGDFTRATLRCVGVGQCRKTESGTMCPSYMVTREEQHSTRGRARLLFEMLRGDLVGPAWRSEPVRTALDLCLSCKACKGECPVRVDMATYKAEFLSHYYAGRLRPRHAYAFGLIHQWMRLASMMPWTAHWLGTRPLAGGLLKRLAGVAPDRRLPIPAPHRARRPGRPGAAGPDGPRVILWADTFNAHFHPEIVTAAGRSTTTACSPRRGDSSSRSSMRCVTRFARVPRSSSSSRAAPASSPTSCRTCFRRTRTRNASGRRPRRWRRSCSATWRRGRRRAAGGRCCTVTATRRRWARWTPRPRSSSSSASRSTGRTPGAAGWPAPSASSAITSTCRWPSVNGCCCRPSDRRLRTPSSSPTGSVVESRWPRRPPREALHLAEVVWAAMTAAAGPGPFAETAMLARRRNAAQAARPDTRERLLLAAGGALAGAALGGLGRWRGRHPWTQR